MRIRHIFGRLVTRRMLNEIKSHEIFLRMHFTHFFAFSKIMQRSLNFVQTLHERMIVIMQLRLFTRARRFFDDIEDEGIKILETRIEKKKKKIVTSLFMI